MIFEASKSFRLSLYFDGKEILPFVSIATKLYPYMFKKMFNYTLYNIFYTLLHTFYQKKLVLVELVYKPDSVLMIIYLDIVSPQYSSNLPEPKASNSKDSYLVLLQTGFTLPKMLPF